MTSAKKQAVPAQIYQLKVTLKAIRPPIWRRFQVPGNITLARLHRILQEVMGWTDTHLHEFTLHGIRYGIPDSAFDDPFDRGANDERRSRLAEVCPNAGKSFSYMYDFGNGWNHQIRIEKILDPVPGIRYPLVLAGKRACPPEDCGGPWGYADFLEAIHDPGHERHQELLDWIGGKFDPEEFDLELINRHIKLVR
jgi:hypothetical protein